MRWATSTPTWSRTRRCRDLRTIPVPGVVTGSQSSSSRTRRKLQQTWDFITCVPTLTAVTGGRSRINPLLLSPVLLSVCLKSDKIIVTSCQSASSGWTGGGLCLPHGGDLSWGARGKTDTDSTYLITNYTDTVTTRVRKAELNIGRGPEDGGEVWASRANLVWEVGGETLEEIWTYFGRWWRRLRGLEGVVGGGGVSGGGGGVVWVLR